ncbi:MAG: hypothetical protein AAF371_17575 [Pseudomonadota bacterium]
MITLANYTLEIEGGAIEVGFLRSWLIAAAKAAEEDASEAGKAEAAAQYGMIAEFMAAISPEAFLSADAFQKALAANADLLTEADTSLDAMLDLFGGVSEQGPPGKDPLGADPRLTQSDVEQSEREMSFDLWDVADDTRDEQRLHIREALGISDNSLLDADEAFSLIGWIRVSNRQELLDHYKSEYPEDFDEDGNLIDGTLPDDLTNDGDGAGGGGPFDGPVEGSGYEGREMGRVESFLVKLGNFIDGNGWTDETTSTEEPAAPAERPAQQPPAAEEPAEEDTAPENRSEGDGFDEEDWPDEEEDESFTEDEDGVIDPGLGDGDEDQMPDQNAERGGGDPTATDSSDGHTDGRSGNGSGAGGTTQPASGDEEDEPDLILFYDPLTPLVNPGSAPLDDTFVYENLRPVAPYEGTTQPIDCDTTPPPELPTEPIGGGGTYAWEEPDSFLF